MKAEVLAPAVQNSSIKTGSFHGVNRFAVGLDYLAQPDYLAFSLPSTHCALVCNEGTELTSAVVTVLKEKGNQVVVLNLPSIKQTITENAITLSAATDEAIQTAVQSIHTQYGKIGTFIHLHPHFEFQGSHFTQHFAAEKEIVKIVFFLAKHIQQDLNELGQRQRANFLSVTRMDGMLGQGKRNNTSIIGGGLTGLVKCLNLEWSSVFCRALDIQAELPTTQISQQLIAELHDPNVALIEVGVSEAGRKTSVAMPTPVKENQMIETTVSRDSVFLVSGGAKGITATCVIDMAKAFQCKFILLGRSSIEEEVPAFAKGESDEGALKRLIMNDLKEKGEAPSLSKVKSIYSYIVAKKEIDQTLAEIKALGGEAIYIKGDVTTLSTFRTALDQAVSQLGEITGIIHGAGRLADKYIQDKTENDFENVLSVKLDGLLSLLAAVNLNQLDHLVLFSSVAGFYGNVGQTDYAIANEILSKAAHLFRTNHPEVQVSAINWGAWDSGMVSGELKKQFEAIGVTLVNSEGGAAMLVNELNKAYADQPQVVIGGTLPAAVSHIGPLYNHRIERKIRLADNPFLNHHMIQGQPVLPSINAIGWMAESGENLYPDFKTTSVEGFKLFKGILFDGSEKDSYLLELKELEKTAEKIVFESTISSEGDRLPTYHYRVKITLTHKRSLPQAPSFTQQLSGSYAPTDGAILYKDGSLFHGEYFQGIQQVLDYTNEQLVLSCKLPAIPLDVQGQFPAPSFNTYFADLLYQGMLVWVQKNKNGAKSLPLSTDHIEVYQAIPFDQDLGVTITVQETSEEKLVAKCTVYDEQGSVYLQMSGAAVTISKQLVW